MVALVKVYASDAPAASIRPAWSWVNPSESGEAWFGLGPPLVIGVGLLAVGIPVMLAWSRGHPDFFRRRPETAPEEGESVVVIAPEPMPGLAGGA
ncbi:MAG: hypothetical protein ACRDYV_01780 [Acidimicrobiia bacterium]